MWSKTLNKLNPTSGKILLFIDDKSLPVVLNFLLELSYFNINTSNIYVIKRSNYTKLWAKSCKYKDLVNEINFVSYNIINKKISIYTQVKFDYIIQNPPYKKSLHLDFFEKGLELLKKDGKMVIIEPSTWLINIRKNGRAKKYNEIKQKIEGHIESIVIENYNVEFRTDNYMPFSITICDFSKTYDSFYVYVCGEKRKCYSIYDANLIGEYTVLHSILEKILKYHTFASSKKTKTQFNNNKIYYIKVADIISGAGSQLCAILDPKRSSVTRDQANNIDFSKKEFDICFDNDGVRDHLQVYTTTCYHRYKNEISNKILYAYDRGKHLTNNPALCLYGTKEELENWKYFVFNNSLPLFINIVMTIDQHNNSLEYVPWLVDKKYTDEEIYKMCNFTEEEIELIENTIKKYERNSAWFKRYMTGDTSIQIDQNEPWKEVK